MTTTSPATVGEINLAALRRAEDATQQWAVYIDPHDAERSMRDHLLGGLAAEVDPATFAKCLAAAEKFAGKPTR